MISDNTSEIACCLASASELLLDPIPEKYRKYFPAGGSIDQFGRFSAELSITFCA